MANIININEENNILSFADEPLDIVCGNTNYCLNFNFSAQWQQFTKKIAVFVANGEKQLVEFQESECAVPAMPNASSCFVYVLGMAGENESFISTSLRLKLIPTCDSTAEADLEGFKNYLSLALEKLKQFEEGNYKAKVAEKSESQVDIKENQTVEGSKNFVGELLYGGKDVATLSQFSNDNLLANGDFSVNQRGKNYYQGKNGLTIFSADRWKILGQNTSFNLTTKKLIIYVNHTFSQVVEIPTALRGQMVTACFSVGTITKEINAFVSDGTNEVTKKLEVGENVISFEVGAEATTLEVGFRGVAINSNTFLNFVKLEVGDKFTGFRAKSAREELEDCQKYYYVKTTDGDEGIFGAGMCISNSEARVSVKLPVQMRVAPTVTATGDFCICSANIEAMTTFNVLSFEGDSVTLSVVTATTVSGMGAMLRANATGASISFDAEIY